MDVMMMDEDENRHHQEAPRDSYKDSEREYGPPHDPCPMDNPDTPPTPDQAPPEVLARLWSKWYPGRAPGQTSWHAVDNVREMYAIFGMVDPSQPVLADDVNSKFKELSSELAVCLNALDKSGDLRKDGNDAMIRMMLRKLEASRQLLLGVSMLHSADTMQPSDLPPDDYGLWRFIPPDNGEEDPNPGQRLRMFALLDCMKSGFRRYRTSFMKRVMTPDGLPTCAWKEAISIEDYVRSLTGRRLTDPRVWFDMTSGAGWAPAKQLADYLTHSDDPEVPWLEPDRHVWSFANGVYLAKDELFIPYNRISAFFNRESYPVACKHFNIEFDPENLKLDDPMSIPTPALDEIFNTQKLSPDVRRWTLCLFGRLFYSVGELDDWQVFPFIKGLAGTGKSVLLNHIKRIYDARDVGIISNTIEKQFGFGQIAGKFIGIADDIRNGFQLDQSDFQNACSGNAVSVAIKHDKPQIIDPWTTGLLLSGNEPPGYHDNSGSFGRRMAVIQFDYNVENPDGSMAQRLLDEMPSFIAKCNRQYRNMIRRHGTQGIWTILPAEFKKQRAELTATSNALIGFLASSLLKKGEGLYMPIDTIRDEVMAYAMRNNLEKPHWGPDYYRGPLTQEHLTLSDEVERRYYPRNQRVTRSKSRIVYGCDLVANSEVVGENGQDAFLIADKPGGNGKKRPRLQQQDT